MTSTPRYYAIIVSAMKTIFVGLSIEDMVASCAAAPARLAASFSHEAALIIFIADKLPKMLDVLYI